MTDNDRKKIQSAIDWNAGINSEIERLRKLPGWDEKQYQRDCAKREMHALYEKYAAQPNAHWKPEDLIKLSDLSVVARAN